MSGKEADYRKDRIERLLYELQYEITRGIMQHEIDEHLQFSWVMPTTEPGKTFVVARFVVRPEAFFGRPFDDRPQIKLVVNNT